MLSNLIFKRIYSNTSFKLARILATDKVDSLCIEIFQKRGHEIDLIPTKNENDLLKIIDLYDGLVVRSATKVTPNLLRAAKKMRIVGRAGISIYFFISCLFISIFIILFLYCFLISLFI